MALQLYKDMANIAPEYYFSQFSLSFYLNVALWELRITCKSTTASSKAKKPQRFRIPDLWQTTITLYIVNLVQVMLLGVSTLFNSLRENPNQDWVKSSISSVCDEFKSFCAFVLLVIVVFQGWDESHDAFLWVLSFNNGCRLLNKIVSFRLEVQIKLWNIYKH